MLNKKLENLYKSTWQSLSDELNEILNNENLCVKPTYPLLLKIEKEEEYLNSDIRIMFFGQETKDWGGDFNDDEAKVENLLDVYDKFFNKKGYKRIGGHFWNAISKLTEKVKDDLQGKSVRVTYNNIRKVAMTKDGKKYNHHPKEYRGETEIRIIRQEVKILKPDVTIFLTGPYYDDILKDNFSDIEYHGMDGFTDRQLSKIKINGAGYGFRTYHPCYLNYQGTKFRDRVFDTIVKNISHGFGN